MIFWMLASIQPEESLMTAHPADKDPYRHAEAPVEPATPGAAVLKGIHTKAQQRWARQTEQVAATERHETARQRMLQAFYGFAAQEKQLDARSPKRIDEPALAHAIHEFAHKAVIKRSNDHGIALETIDDGRVSKNIDQHYADFSLTRDAVTGRKKERELDAIDRMRRKIYVQEYADTDANVGQPRTRRYPEIGITLELREALMEDGSALSTEASEVVLAAYGSTFPPVTSYRSIELQDETGAVIRKIEPNWPRERDNPMVRNISAEHIPEDQQAENWQAK
jgi:hypothetical protein